MKCNTTEILAFVMKTGIFLSLFIVFYIFYFINVAKKYTEENTNLAFSQQTISKVKPPFFTLCMDPSAKFSALEKLNVSVHALNEPNDIEEKILFNLNKTVKDLFLEATCRLNEDFEYT